MLFHIRNQLGIAVALLLVIPFVFGLAFSTDSAILEARNNTTSHNNSSSYKVAAYFVNWAIYERNYSPQQIPASQLTHLLYAFANVSPNGTVYLSDPWSDVEKLFSTDSSNDPDVNENVYGCIKQVYLLKKKNRQMKTLLSIGGWTYSTNFAEATSTNDTRTTFANTAVTLAKDLGFDGLDIDWEYPKDDTEASNFVLLLQAIRSAFDTYATNYSLPNNFLLTIASPAGPTHYNIMHLKEMDRYLDSWHLMAYDYAGSFSSLSGHDANLYPSIDNPDSTPFSTDKAVNDYIAAGVNASKTVLGMPIYGRSFENTNGMGESYDGVGPGTWEAGVYDYKDLPFVGANVTYNSSLGASYSYNPTTKELVSYDTVEVIQQKVHYIENQGLGGAMFWETSADGNGSLSLISTASKGLGNLEVTENCLDYPASRYPNLRAGMPDNYTASAGSQYN